MCKTKVLSIMLEVVDSAIKSNSSWGTEENTVLHQLREAIFDVGIKDSDTYFDFDMFERQDRRHLGRSAETGGCYYEKR